MKKLTNEDVFRIGKKLFKKIIQTFDFPYYDEEDILQEIYVKLLSIDLDHYNKHHSSNASLDTYCYRAVYNEFLNLRQKLLYLSDNPCSPSCPFYVSYYKDCCDENIKEQCPYYNKYRLLIRSKLNLVSHFPESVYRVCMDTSDYEMKDIIDDACKFALDNGLIGKDSVEHFKEIAFSVFENNDVSDKDRDLLQHVFAQYIKQR